MAHNPRISFIETADGKAGRAQLAANPMRRQVLVALAGRRFCIAGPQGGVFPVGAAEREG